MNSKNKEQENRASWYVWFLRLLATSIAHRRIRFRWGQRNSRRTKPVVSREAKELHNRKHTRGALFREIPSSDIRKVLNKRVR